MKNLSTPTALYSMNIGDEEPIFLDRYLAERACIIIRTGCARALVAFVVMPDHLHILFKAASIDLARDYSRLLTYSFASIKEISAHGIKEMMVYPTEMEKSVRYIEENPVRTGLCEKPQDYLWSSASPIIFPNFESLRESSAKTEG